MMLAQAKHLIEAPVNGGRNYKKLTDCSYVKKLGYMLETPEYPSNTCFESSNNLRGADNQQERFLKEYIMLKISDIPPHIGYYLAGFTDGKGSFNISFHQQEQQKISLSFKVSQRDKVILALFKKHLKCGTLRSSSDGIWHYEVSNLNALVENVIPFFKKFGFLSATKKRDFSRFKQVTKILVLEEPLTETSLKNILRIKSEIDSGAEN